MYVIAALDVNEAMQRGIEHLLCEGVEESSRNGPVLVAPGPVCTEYLKPRNRVVYSPTRDANPLFHLMESLWMLAGDNDIEFPCYFNSTYGQFSDDGKTMWDAYGWRWRRFFGWDQIEAIVTELRANPASRRCVLSMWNPAPLDGAWHTEEVGVPAIAPRKVPDLIRYETSPTDDFYRATHGGKAVPCNTHAYLDCRGGVLNMTICNRSNDILFGCYGANVVHMSFLQEYLAMRVGVPVGVYRQMSNNFHAYLNVFPRQKLEQIAWECDTLGKLPEPGPTLEEGFDEDLTTFMRFARKVINNGTASDDGFNTKFFQEVAVPMFFVWANRKQGRKEYAEELLSTIKAPNWHRACSEWIERRKK